jgi:hypothetical protein
MMSELLAQDKQKEIFLRLVEEQDAGSSVEQSRQRVSQEFHISLTELFTIEQQGRLHQWPPLA